MNTLKKAIGFAGVAGLTFGLWTAVFGYLSICVLHLHDPWPIGAEWGMVLFSLWVAIPSFSGLYLVGLAMAWRETRLVNWPTGTTQGVAISMLAAGLLAWRDIPREEAVLVNFEDLFPVVLVVVTFLLTRFLANRAVP